MTLLLLWFPIILAVGVGGRLLGRARGLALGVLCALFWIVLVQASNGVGLWQDPWTVATIVAGAIAIAAIGAWSGETPIESSLGRPSPRASSQAGILNEAADERTTVLQNLCDAIEQFDDWLEKHRTDRDPWPKFDEFIRMVMYQCCRATHVKPYRLVSERDELVTLSTVDSLLDTEPLSARHGIVGKVVTTGRSYVANDMTQGELVERLAEQSADKVAWCFAIRQGPRRLGAVLVGWLGVAPEPNKPLLRAVEQLINQFWCTLAEVVRSRSAVQIDPVSGLCARPAFLSGAEESLQDSYRQGEPVAVAVVALEGLRRMNDSGWWERGDELIREVSDVLRRKVRMDDRLGRFDSSRFIFLIRRVDSELASLIVSQILARLTEICGDEERWGTAIGVRCGVVGSGTEKPDLRALVSQALVQCHRARTEDTSIASDLRPTAVRPTLPSIT